MLKSEFAWVEMQKACKTPQKAQKTLEIKAFLGQNHGLSGRTFFRSHK